MLTLAKGALLARVVGFASVPVLTRIYSPEDYGILALYTSLVMILAPVLTLRYVQAIPLPKTDGAAINLFSVCLKLIFLGSIIMALILFAFSSAILGWFDMQALVPWWPLIVLGAAGTALYELFSLWATRKKQYEILAKTQVTQSMAGNLAKIVLGLLAIKPAGLLIGQFIAQSGGVGGFIKQSWKSFNRLLPRIDRRVELFISRYYRDFPFYRLPSQLLMIISQQAPVLIAAALYGKEVTGQLSLAIMALSLPIGLMGQAVGKAYYAEVASVGRRDIKRVCRITIDVQKKLFLVATPLVILVMVSSEFVFSIVFGNEWRVAGQFSGILAPYLLFSFTSAPLVQVLNLLASQKLYLIINAMRALGVAALFYLVSAFEFASKSFVILYSSYISIFLLCVTLYIVWVLYSSAKKQA